MRLHKKERGISAAFLSQNMDYSYLICTGLPEWNESVIA